MTETIRAPDMRNPEKSDARKAAEKEIGNAPFTRKEGTLSLASHSVATQGPTPAETAKQ